MKPKRKLYVWTDFCPDYSGGLAFAIAASEKSAKQLIMKNQGYEVYDWGTLTVHPLSRAVAFSVTGGM